MADKLVVPVSKPVSLSVGLDHGLERVHTAKDVTMEYLESLSGRAYPLQACEHVEVRTHSERYRVVSHHSQVCVGMFVFQNHLPVAPRK